MQLPAPGRVYLAIAVTALGLALIGCQGCDDEVDEPPPWKFSSDRASYEVIFPPEWSRESGDAINPNSDIEVHRDEKLFFLVIPQKLPEFPTPDLLRFKEQGLRSLDETVDNFVVRRRGTLEIDGVSGFTVFASGEFEGEDISYITSYVIHDEIGYQLIAFGTSDDESKLFEDVDLILSHWKFIGEDEKEDPLSATGSEFRDPNEPDGTLPTFDDGDETSTSADQRPVDD